MDLESDRLYAFLHRIQLDQFHDLLRDTLHVTRIEHFEHVEQSDLLQVKMTMPEIRRLFDSLKKTKRKKENFLSKLKVGNVYFCLDWFTEDD